MLSLSEAAKTAGVSKSTIWRACKAGRVSFKRTDTGEFQIDAAELHRVFPFRAIGENGKMNHHAIGVAQTETAILDARISALKEMAELMREHLEDVRKDRDAWRAQAEANQRLVADARTRRGLFGWGAKR
jgi:predicted site-specific integrase-resolvase